LPAALPCTPNLARLIRESTARTVRRLLSGFKFPFVILQTPFEFSRRSIERILAEEVLPYLPGFPSMSYLERTPPSKDSRWRLNHLVPSLIGG
jgi:hypothetical protein